jgi:hypothetical protein
VATLHSASYYCMAQGDLGSSWRPLPQSWPRYSPGTLVSEWGGHLDMARKPLREIGEHPIWARGYCPTLRPSTSSQQLLSNRLPRLPWLQDMLLTKCTSCPAWQCSLLVHPSDFMISLVATVFFVGTVLSSQVTYRELLFMVLNLSIQE